MAGAALLVLLVLAMLPSIFGGEPGPYYTVWERLVDLTARTVGTAQRHPLTDIVGITPGPHVHLHGEPARAMAGYLLCFALPPLGSTVACLILAICCRRRSRARRPRWTTPWLTSAGRAAYVVAALAATLGLFSVCRGVVGSRRGARTLQAALADFCAEATPALRNVSEGFQRVPALLDSALAAHAADLAPLAALPAALRHTAGLLGELRSAGVAGEALGRRAVGLRRTAERAMVELRPAAVPNALAAAPPLPQAAASAAAGVGNLTWLNHSTPGALDGLLGLYQQHINASRRAAEFSAERMAFGAEEAVFILEEWKSSSTSDWASEAFEADSPFAIWGTAVVGFSALPLLWLLPGVAALLRPATSLERLGLTMASSVSTCFVLFYALGVAGWHVAGYVLHTGCQAMPDQLDAALRAPIALPDVLLVSPAGLLRCSAGDRLSDLLLVRPPPLFNAGHELSRWPADLQSRLSALALGDGLWRLTEALRDARGKTAMPVAPWSGSDLSRMVTALEEGQQRLDGLRLEGDSYRAAAAQLQRLNAAAGQALTLDTVTAYRPRGAAEAALCSDVRRRRAALVAEVAALAEAVRELRGAAEDLSNLTATIDDLLRDVSASVDQLEIAWASSAKGAQAVTERTGQLWREWQRPLEVTGCAAVGTAYRRLVGGLCHEVGSGVLAVAQGYLLQWLVLLAVVPVALCAAGPTSGGPRPLPSSPSSASRSSTPSSDWAGASLLQDNAL